MHNTAVPLSFHFQNSNIMENKNSSKKLNLTELKNQLPQLKETKQGQLKGGFVAFKSNNPLSLGKAFSTNVNQVEGCTCTNTNC